MTTDPFPSPGWDSINAVLAQLYGEQEPEQFGTTLQYSLGGPDPLDAISAYWRDEPRPHLFILSRLAYPNFTKRGERSESGFGFEFTFRLAQEIKEEVPMWVLGFLNNPARYVFGSGKGLVDGHHLNLNGQIALDTDTAIPAVAPAQAGLRGGAVRDLQKNCYTPGVSFSKPIFRATGHTERISLNPSHENASLADWTTASAVQSRLRGLPFSGNRELNRMQCEAKRRRLTFRVMRKAKESSAGLMAKKSTRRR